jgi:hypothetical protein
MISETTATSIGARGRARLEGTTLLRLAGSWYGKLAAIVAAAVFLRLYDLTLKGWTPDTYEQLFAARRLAAGEFPISNIYPPGVAVTLAPFMAVFPATQETMQGVIIAASLLLIVVAATAVRRATGDDGASLLLALGLAGAPLFVFFSRDALFDVINTLWIVSLVLVVPALARRGWIAGAWFGVALAIACTIRATNVSFLPVVLLYWLAVHDTRSLKAALSCVMRPVVLSSAVTLCVSYALLAYLGGWLGGGTAGAPVGLGSIPPNAGYYYVMEFGGPVAAPVVLVFTIAGIPEVWRRNRALAIVSLCMVVFWPFPHAPLAFANSRYMLPSSVFVLILAAHGHTAIGRFMREGALGARRWGRPLLAAGAILIAGFVAADAAMLAGWGDRAARSDEGAYRQLRPIVRELPADALLVSAATRGVSEANRSIGYFDLIDHSTAEGSKREDIDAGVAEIAAEVQAGRPVYYLYSRLDADGTSLGRRGLGFREYFISLDERYRMELVFDTGIADFRLYRMIDEGS